MHQELPSQYYLVVDEKSTGPFSLEEILMHPALTPETLVWKPGIENWVAAQTLPELAQAFIRQQNQHSFESQNPQFDQNPNQFQPQNNPNQNPPYQNYPPYTQNNPYNQYQNNPYNNRYNPYQNPNPYQNGYNRQNVHTNWMPWAIVATVVGFFASCIGAIFGIIGIVQANKANTLYAQGLEREADSANSSARTMTIIGLVLAGIGLIFFLFFGSFFSSLSDLSYY